MMIPFGYVAIEERAFVAKMEELHKLEEEVRELKIRNATFERKLTIEREENCRLREQLETPSVEKELKTQEVEKELKTQEEVCKDHLQTRLHAIAHLADLRNCVQFSNES